MRILASTTMPIIHWIKMLISISKWLPDDLKFRPIYISLVLLTVRPR